MSVTTRKQLVWTSNGVGDRVARMGRPVGSLASKTMPLAQTAGTTVRQGAGSAIAMATPAVEAARSWAAPQLEQSAHAITDTIAPMISDALITAAHKIDVPRRRKKRVRGGVVAGAVALTAAAGAATFAAIRLRRQDSGFAADAEDVTAVPPAGPGPGEEPGPDPEADGHSRIV
ncbi:MAG: hypothetical protein ACRDOK_09285 [Streptosporangiaceae bacterium]